MKWFKHYSNASDSTSINNLIDTHGIKFYAHYFLFIELLSEKFDGENTEIELNLSVIGRKVRLKFTKSVTTFLQLLPNFFKISIKIEGKVCKVKYDKLLEIKDNHTKNLQAAGKLLARKLPLDKDKDKEEDKDKEKKILKKCEFKKRAVKFLERFNLEADKQFSLKADSNLKNIISALKSNYSEEDLYQILQVKLKDQYYIDNSKYINPTTIYAPSKMEIRMQEVRDYVKGQ